MLAIFWVVPLVARPSTKWLDKSIPMETVPMIIENLETEDLILSAIYHI